MPEKSRVGSTPTAPTNTPPPTPGKVQEAIDQVVYAARDTAGTRNWVDARDSVKMLAIKRTALLSAIEADKAAGGATRQIKMEKAALALVTFTRKEGYCTWCDSRLMGRDKHEPDCEVGSLAALFDKEGK